MKEIKLKHGHTLKITPAPFAEANALFKAVLVEGKALGISVEDEQAKLYKDIFCAAFSSELVEAALAPCMKRCLYNDQKIDADTFEKEEARENYMSVITEVAMVNLAPFTKGLFVALPRLTEMMQNVRA